MEKYVSNKISVPVSKIEKYLLNPTKPHFHEFFEIGYASGNGRDLFADIELQFDISKGMQFIYYEDGVFEFVIYMLLGKIKKRTFKTVWRKDDKAELPRFITAYRDKEGEKYV